MFNWLRRIARKEPAAAREERVAVEELEKWFSIKVNAKFNDIKEEIQSYYNRIAEIKDDAIENMEKLQRAELMNRNIPEKALQIMEGNKLSYIEKTNSFLGKIAVPKDIILKTTVDFCSSVESLLAELAKSNIRSYAIMQEFFANESKAIAMNIKSIEQQIALIKELMNRKNGELTKAEQTKELIEEFIHLINLSKKMRNDIRMYEGQLRFVEEKNIEFDKRIEKLRQSNDYGILNRKKEDIEKLNKDIEGIKAKVSELFSPVKKAMKKYEHICFEDKDVLVSYNKDDFEALQNDNGFRIIKVLQGMKKALEKNELEIKDKQKQKMVSAIDSINEEALNKFVELIKNAKQGLKQLNDELSGLGINDAIQDVEYRKQHLKDKEKRTLMEIEKSRKIMAKFNLDELEKKVLEDIHSILGINVILARPADEN